MAITAEEIFERVKEVLVEQLGVDESVITMDSAFQKDLDADSLDLVEMIMEMEDQFGVKIRDDDAQKLVTVRDVVNYVLSVNGLPPTSRDDDAAAPVPVGPSGSPSAGADGAMAEEAVTDSTP